MRTENANNFTMSSIAADRERLALNFSKIVNGSNRDDAAFELGRQLKVSKKRYNYLDELSFEQAKDEHVAKRICDEAGKHEYDRELALRQLISFEPATSVEGALVQVAESISALDLIWDQFPKENEEFVVLQDYRRLQRLLFSVLRFLRSQSIQDVDDHCNGLGLDPWIEAEEAIDRHRAVCENHERERLARIERITVRVA